MNININNQYLNFEDDIEIERQVKLFEEAASSVGDFSYSFEFDGTAHNRAIIQLYSVNQSGKLIYTKIPAILESKGTPVYFGYIKVENDRGKKIEASFFSGNSNWFNDLNFKLRDFDFSTWDVDWDVTSVSARDTATTGVIFPVIDVGSLKDRSYVNWHIDELHPFIYVKSTILTLLNRSGLKLTGDILQDWRYNHLITSNAEASAPQEEVNDRSVNVNKSSTQNVTGAPDVITFANTTGDFYPGDLWNTGTNSFTADVKMTLEISMTIEMTVGAANIGTVLIFKNGAVFSGAWYVSNSVAAVETSKTVTVTLEEGDEIDFRGVETISAFDVNSATLKIVPIRLHKVFSTYLLPDKLAKDYVAQVFALFNPVINYDGNSKTLEVNLFKNVIRKPELDISEYIDTETIEDNYSELMENYGQSNVLGYSESDADISERYNNGSVLPYGSGELLSENETAQPSVTILESDFVAAMEDVKNPFKTFLPKLAWRSLSESSLNDEGVSLTNSGGLTFTASGYAIGDIVRVENSTEESYNGEWIVSSATATTFRVAGLNYIANATADIVKLDIDFESSDEQALLLALPNYDLSSFTNVTQMFYADSSAVTGASPVATAYFYKPLQGLDIDDFKQSLSFGPVNIPNAHQSTMIEDYWLDFENVLKDPVKIIAGGNFPVAVFKQLFDGPLRLKTSRHNVRLFMNRTTGYKERAVACIAELVKV